MITLIGVQLILGKKISFPYGVLMGLSPVYIGIVALASDFALMPFALLLSDNSKRIGWLEKLRRKLFADEKKVRESKWLKRFQNMGKVGVVLIVSIPGAGGVWTGAVLSHILNLKKLETYILLGLGSAIGCIIFILCFHGIMNWVL
ncbi:MAG: small multi-drug export protein [candidate division Zixibacteria bacterium]|nr:small multi-drug export protein [Candidatus Tariuqbacter arcticus]